MDETLRGLLRPSRPFARGAIVTGVLVACLFGPSIGGLGKSLGLGALAWACGPKGNNHCYATAHWGATTNGGRMTFRSGCLSVSDPKSNFVDNEEWVYFGTSTSDPDHWIEAGMTYGLPVSRPAFFMADKRPGHPYVEHDSTLRPQLGTDYNASISPSGPGQWDVDVGGFSKTVRGQPGPSDGLEAGLETYNSTGVHESGHTSDMGWYSTTGGSLQSPWGSSAGQSNDPGINSFNWDTFASSFSESMGSCSGSIAASTAAPQVPAFQLNPPDPSYLEATATRVAISWGEPDPTNMSAVLDTLRGTAVRVISDGDTLTSETEVPVDIVTEHGQFRATDAPTPAGASPPTGTVLSLVIDMKTGEILDEALGDYVPDLSQAGKVVHP